jgi:hypothetical protein
MSPLLTEAEAQGIRDVLFDTTVKVYGEGAGGVFDSLLRDNLAAQFQHVRRQPAATAEDRAELAALRELRWDPTYVLPEHAQVQDTAGLRWNPVPGTFAAIGPGGVLVFRQCDLVRVL